MKSFAFVVAALVLCILCGRCDGAGNQTKTRAQKDFESQKAYLDYLRRYKIYKKMYQSQYDSTLDKFKCKMAPVWQINGSYPVYDEIEKGNAVFLFLIKKSCLTCFNELPSWEDWAKYYKKIGEKVTIVVLNHKYYDLKYHLLRKDFPNIKFYQEPKDQNIFKLLKGKPHDVILYDKCGRQQYDYEYPYGSFQPPYLRLAMSNTLIHYETFCGKCTPFNYTMIYNRRAGLTPRSRSVNSPVNITNSVNVSSVELNEMSTTILPTTNLSSPVQPEPAVVTKERKLRNIDGPHNDEFNGPRNDEKPSANYTVNVR